jgi:hypothetical protein
MPDQLTIFNRAKAAESVLAGFENDLHFDLSVFRNVFSLSKSEKRPLFCQNCAVTLQKKKIEIWRVSMF